MTERIECIPNFSEGRDGAVVEALAAAARGVAGVSLLNYSADASHNRSVFTLTGEPEAVAEAAYAMVALAAKAIDLTAHEGEHPRMGAADVVPFVPLDGVSMAQCVALAQRTGRRVSEELGIPVFLYEEAASATHRRNLADVRRGGFEGLAQKMLLPEWAPDFGEARPHPSAGAVAIGARAILIAFNVNLDTPDLAVAQQIARAVRGSSGGLKHCKAIGVMLEGRQQAQVSMNITDYRQTPLYRVVEMVRMEARRYGVGIAGTELIGLAPAEALAQSAAYYMQVEGFSDGQILK